VADIANGAREQATALQGINVAVNQLDHGTQQNAVVVKESVTAVHALAKETDELARLVGQFKVGSEAAAKRLDEIESPALRSQQQSWCVTSMAAATRGALATA
jgi:methyl-accepting chemotaxis protein